MMKSMFEAITGWIHNLIMSYLWYLLGSPDTKGGDYVTLIIEPSGENVLYAATNTYVFSKLGVGSLNIYGDELTLADSYQGIELNWRIFLNKTTRRQEYELIFDKRHKDLVCDSYLPYVESTTKEKIESTTKEKTGEEKTESTRKMKTILEVHTYSHSFDTWETKGFENSSTFETIVMKEEVKRDLIHDLDRFLQGRDFYYRTGRTWTRSYLLYGPPGTGKTSLVAAMANYLDFDIYDLQLSSPVQGYFNPRTLLSGVVNNSILLVEDINEGSTSAALSTLLRSLVLGTPWGEARVVIFTTSNKDMLDSTLVKRICMEIYMGHCSFEGFKALASNYLGLNEEPHPLYPDIKRLIDGQVITPAQVIEALMKREDVDVVLQGLVRTLESLTLNQIDEDDEKHLA